MLQKPHDCNGCALETMGRGFVPPIGPENAELLFLAEAAGSREADVGQPLVGDAGGVFNRLLFRRDISRGAVRIGNTINCQPPRNWLVGAPWEYAAINHCGTYRDKLLAEPHKVIVAMGATAIRTILGLAKVKVQDFHGTVHKVGDKWVVCTFHPSFLQRGGRNLTDVVSHDIRVAQLILAHGWKEDNPELHLDPSSAFFKEWVDLQIAAAESGVDVWCSTDIETPTKIDKGDEGTLTLKDRAYLITRINFCTRLDEALTIPWDPRYFDDIVRLLTHPAIVKIFWNKKYDVPILAVCEPKIRVAGLIIDAMDMFHFWNSDVPRGLGFAAPFSSRYGAWKHLNDDQPALYGAVDGLQTERIAYDVAGKLMANGMWDTFMEHFVEFDQYCLTPAEEVGVLVDVEGLPLFSEELATKEHGFMKQAQARFPEELQQLTPRAGWKKDPGPTWKPSEKNNLSKLTDEELAVFCRKVDEVVPVCKTCGAIQVPNRHKCKGDEFKDAKPVVVPEMCSVDRWFVREPFNPGSPEQVMAYIQHHNHKPGKNPKTGQPSADKTCLQRLAKAPLRGTKAYEPHLDFYQALLDFREVSKVRGTYVDSTLTRLQNEREVFKDFSNRIRPTFSNKPSTFRTSCSGPNLQNVVADRGGKEALAAGFRRYIMAQDGCLLVEADYAAIEAVLTGWFANDWDYIRLAQLGVHAYLCSHLIGKPADLSWSDEKLLEYFGWIKENYPFEYNMAKRCVHGTNYGLTPFGMRERFPSIFPSVAKAKEVQDLYLKLCPLLHAWQVSVQQFAAKHDYLGGPGNHPFNYKHWFWEVYEYKRITPTRAKYLRSLGKPVTAIGDHFYETKLGDDAKRAVAFFPQSTAAGVIRRAGLRLFKPGSEHYIGDCWYGQTPLRAVIHDSFLLEVMEEKVDYVVQCLNAVMTEPVPELNGLNFGCKVEVGKRWSEMHGVKVGTLSTDTTVVDEYEDPDEAAEEAWMYGHSYPA